jgi:hypothetical protein
VGGEWGGVPVLINGQSGGNIFQFLLTLGGGGGRNPSRTYGEQIKIGKENWGNVKEKGEKRKMKM